MSEVICYASILGNCCDKQSAEHYVSKGLWRNKVITFEGLPWLDGKPKNMSVKKVFRKILCETHNKALSILDAEGIKLFWAAAKFHNNQHDRGKLKRSAMWKVDREEVDGRKLERLMAKIAVGVLQENSNEKWHLSNSSAIEPPKEVVEAIYGLREFEPPMGLYCINSVGDTVKNEDHVGLSLLYHPDTKGYIGSIITFRHWQFFINLSDASLENYTLTSATGKQIGKDGNKASYRVQRFNFNSNGKLSGVIRLNW